MQFADEKTTWKILQQARQQQEELQEEFGLARYLHLCRMHVNLSVTCQLFSHITKHLCSGMAFFINYVTCKTSMAVLVILYPYLIWFCTICSSPGFL